MSHADALNPRLFEKMGKGPHDSNETDSYAKGPFGPTRDFKNWGFKNSKYSDLVFGPRL